MPPASEAQSSNHWTASGLPQPSLSLVFFFFFLNCVFSFFPAVLVNQLRLVIDDLH